MNIHPFRASLPSLERIFNPALFFSKAKYLYPVYYKNGYFSKQSTASLFVYRQRTAISNHVGVLAATHIEDYFEGRIIKHEETIEVKEEKMVRLFEERNGQIKPVLLTYPTVAEISDFLAAIIERQNPVQHVQFNGTEHELWALQTPEENAYLADLFRQNVPAAYIADGHHRAATLAHHHRNVLQRLGVLPENSPFNFLFSAFFSTDELAIADYNRTFTPPEGFDKATFLEKLKAVAEVQRQFEPFKPKRKHELALVIEEEWYLVRWKSALLAEISSELEKLDVSLLNQLVFKNIFNAENVRTDTNIDYVGGDKGIKGVLDKMSSKERATIGFLLFPISSADFMTVVDTEGVMPPKSTYFMPRIQNAFVTLMFD